MTTISVRVVGADIVRQGLQNLDREIPQIGASQIFNAFQNVRKSITTYPPPPPRSRYKRTGTYRSAWKIKKNPRRTRKSMGYSLEGRARQRGRDYTKFVGGDAFGRGQAWMHVGRWKVVRVELEDEIKKLPNQVEKHLALAIRRNGL